MVKEKGQKSKVKGQKQPQTTDLRPLTLDFRPQTLDFRPQALDFRPQTFDLRPKFFLIILKRRALSVFQARARCNSNEGSSFQQRALGHLVETKK